MCLLILNGLLQDSAFLDLQPLAVLLLDRLVLRVDVAEDEVELGVGATLVRAEHDGVGRLVVEVSQVHVGLVAKELDVAATAVLASLETKEGMFSFISLPVEQLEGLGPVP